MRRLFFILFISLLASTCFAQLKVNVVLKTSDAHFDGKTESELIASKGEAWAKNWEETVKPSIYADVVEQLRKNSHSYSSHVQFGHFEESDYSVEITLLNMDRDGESEMNIAMLKTSNGAYECLWSKDYQKNGNNTMNYNTITPKAFVRAIDSATSHLFKTMGIKIKVTSNI